MKNVYIYGLIDPRDNNVKYVGKTIQPLYLRLNQHIQSSKSKSRNKTKKAEWILELLSENLKPKIILLEKTTGSVWQKAERKWANFYYPIITNDMNMIGTGPTKKPNAKWTKKTDSLLGKVADAVIAEMVGVTRKAVSYRRNVLGIPASFDKSRMKPPPKMGGHNKLVLPQEVVLQLGKMPDYKLAQLFGLEKSVIARNRKELNIPSFAEQTGSFGTFKKGIPHPRWETEKYKESLSAPGEQNHNQTQSWSAN